MFSSSAFIKVQQSWGKQAVKQAKAISCLYIDLLSARHGDRSYWGKHKGSSCIEGNKCASLREKPLGPIFKLEKHSESTNLRQAAHVPTYTQNGSLQHHHQNPFPAFRVIFLKGKQTDKRQQKRSLLRGGKYHSSVQTWTAFKVTEDPPTGCNSNFHCRRGLKRTFGYVETLCGKGLHFGWILDSFSKTGCGHTTTLKCKILLSFSRWGFEK